MSLLCISLFSLLSVLLKLLKHTKTCYLNSKFERSIPFFKSSIQCLNVLTYKFSKNFATCILQLLDDHRIPTNTDINERLWTGRFGANKTSLRFICRNRFLYLGRTVKL